MGILDQLSSQTGDRTEASNKRVAAQVLREPRLMDELAGGVASADDKLAGDCMEVMTFVAARKPELVVPYADTLIARLDHKDTRVRWEAMHSLEEIAAQVPDKIAALLPRLVEKIALDKSVIVRDHAIRTLGEYGRSSAAAARKAWPHLREALVLWEGKHAGKALEAMCQVASAESTLKGEAQAIARRYTDHKSAKVRTMANRLLKQAAN